MRVCRQIRTDGAPIKTAMPTYPSGITLVPIKVCPCTRSGTSSCPLGYARVPSWVQPRTHTGTPVYQFGYALVPTRVRPCTKSGTTSYPNGFASAPSRVRPRTRMGMPMYRVGYALVPAWVCPCTESGTPSYPDGYPHESTRFPGPPRRLQAQNRRFCRHLKLVPGPKLPVFRINRAF